LCWLRIPQSRGAVEPVDMANIVWAFGTQGADVISNNENDLLEILADYFEQDLARAEAEKTRVHSPHIFSNIIWGLAKLAARGKTGSSSVRELCPAAWATLIASILHSIVTGM